MASGSRPNRTGCGSRWTVSGTSRKSIRIASPPGVDLIGFAARPIRTQAGTAVLVSNPRSAEAFSAVRHRRVETMRLPLLPPSRLSPEQHALYDDMRKGIKTHFKGFATIREDGALMGPWNPWLHEPHFGKPVWQLTKALSMNPSLPPAVREVAILVTG